ncbi:MAG: hypothetical protein LC808_08090 [Actinobacteria bacterium]|nr:hypothetical protein [Actinomycetota bacterium]
MIEKRERKRRDGKTYSVYRVRWYEAAGRERSRSFDSRADAKVFEGKVRTLKRSDGLAQLDAGTETFAEFAAEWWELYAKPNLERATLRVESGALGAEAADAAGPGDHTAHARDG